MRCGVCAVDSLASAERLRGTNDLKEQTALKSYSMELNEISSLTAST